MTWPDTRHAGGFASLLDMFNTNLGDACICFRQLVHFERNLQNRDEWARSNQTINEPHTEPFWTSHDGECAVAFLRYWAETASHGEMPSTADRVRLFEVVLASPVSLPLSRYLAETRALREAVEGDLRRQFYYRYPADRVSDLRNFEVDWRRTLDAFPSCRKDAFAAVDCFALELYDASVFYAMRVAERGLRALAKERRAIPKKGRPIEWSDWQGIITAIEAQVKLMGAKAAGPKRDAALEYYNGALAHFRGFKDAYRNSVSHGRKEYDQYEAGSALAHVRDFMNRLSGRLTEKPRRIAWGIR